MIGLFKTLAGIFLIQSACSIETLNENNIISSESNHTLNHQVTDNIPNKNQSLSSDNAMEMCNQTFQTPKGK